MCSKLVLLFVATIQVSISAFGETLVESLTMAPPNFSSFECEPMKVDDPESVITSIKLIRVGQSDSFKAEAVLDDGRQIFSSSPFACILDFSNEKAPVGFCQTTLSSILDGGSRLTFESQTTTYLDTTFSKSSHTVIHFEFVHFVDTKKSRTRVDRLQFPSGYCQINLNTQTPH